MLSRDRRFDGRFFVGVKSTRIYCRPVCTVRPPLKKNCRFFLYAAAAEISGFRPCLRCRPELAPGAAAVDATARLSSSALRLIDEGAMAEGNISDLADELGVTSRHLRRVFKKEVGISPIEFWQTRRLLLAKGMMTDTQLPATRVAEASGFKSLRRFNAAFKSRYRLSPTQVRASRRRALAENSKELVPFCLGYRPPFDWGSLMHFLSRRMIPGCESAAGGVYRRTICLKRKEERFTGWLEVRNVPETNSLAVGISESLLPVCFVVLEKVKYLFDLQADPAEINVALGDLSKPYPGLRVPGSFDPFEMAIRAILGQQISVAGASTLAGRLASKFGQAISTPYAELTTLFPTADVIANATTPALASIGLTRGRAGTISALAKAVAEDRLHLHWSEQIGALGNQLRALPGIGEWTVQYLAMRALRWPDAFPAGDLGLKKALGETHVANVLKRAEAWRPWRAYAAIHLWKSLEKPV